MIALLRVNLYPWVPFFSGLGKAKCWWVERQNGRICLVWSILQHQPSTWRGTLGSMGWSPSPLLSIRNSTGCSSFPIVNCQTEENCPKEMGRERCEGPSGFGSVGAALTGLTYYSYPPPRRLRRLRQIPYSSERSPREMEKQDIQHHS